jgi:hypothetical protein
VPKKYGMVIYNGWEKTKRRTRGKERGEKTGTKLQSVDPILHSFL